SRQSLWSTAPGWRRLLIGSGMLTALALSAPIFLSRLAPAPVAQAVSVGPATQSGPTQQSCSLQIPDAPQYVTARVTGMVQNKDVSAATRTVESQTGAKISPPYLALPRVAAEVYPTGPVTMAAIPANMTVNIGDLVELSSRYRDRSLPCHFIPWTINRVI